MTKDEQIAELKRVIEELQWGSCDGCGQRSYCPICDAPKAVYDNELDDYGPGKHKEDCPVGKALG